MNSHENEYSLMKWATETLTLPGRIVSLCMEIVETHFQEVDEYDPYGTTFQIKSRNILDHLESFVGLPILESEVVVIPCEYGLDSYLWFSVCFGDDTEDTTYSMRLAPWVLA